jgi:hypothetical protein
MLIADPKLKSQGFGPCSFIGTGYSFSNSGLVITKDGKLSKMITDSPLGLVGSTLGKFHLAKSLVGKAIPWWVGVVIDRVQVQWLRRGDAWVDPVIRIVYHRGENPEDEITTTWSVFIDLAAKAAKAEKSACSTPTPV